jgi:hypothetical protein
MVSEAVKQEITAQPTQRRSASRLTPTSHKVKSHRAFDSSDRQQHESKFHVKHS